MSIEVVDVSAPTLRTLRAQRTRAHTRVRHLIDHSVLAEARYLAPDGLPTWWPFWSDVLKGAVRDLVRAARELEVKEGGTK